MGQYSTTKSKDVLAFGPLAGRGSSDFLRLRWQVFKGSSMVFGFFRFPIFSGGNTWHNDTQIANAAPAM